MVKIKRAKTEHVPAIVAIEHEYWKVSQYGKAGLPFNAALAEQMTLHTMEKGIMQVAVTEDEVVGAIGLVVGPIPFSGKAISASEIGFYVRPEYRDQGVGKKLLKQAEHVAKQMGVEMISMIHLHEKLGERAENVYVEMGYSPTEVMYTKVI